MFSFFKKVFSKRKSITSNNKNAEESLTSDDKEDGTIVKMNFRINLSEEAQKKRNEEWELEYQNRWKYKEPNVSYYMDDGTPVYATQWVNNAERKEIGFFGKKCYSENKKYCLVTVASNDYENNIALVEVDSRKVLFKTKLNISQINTQAVTNSGISAVCETNGKSDIVIIMDNTGNILHRKRHNYIVNSTPFKFIENEKKFIYQTCTNYKTYTIEL
ncbi:hypothetical protein PG588_07915 [Riemerella anatipestifer]|nr:hypothetical protein [Riemerella anatipestifer]